MSTEKNIIVGCYLPDSGITGSLSNDLIINLDNLKSVNLGDLIELYNHIHNQEEKPRESRIDEMERNINKALLLDMNKTGRIEQFEQRVKILVEQLTILTDRHERHTHRIYSNTANDSVLKQISRPKVI